MTRLLGAPLRESSLSVSPGEGAVLLYGGGAALDLLEHVEVILNVFESAVVGELLEQSSDLLLSNAHRMVSMA